MLCEKPLALSLDSADRILEAAEKSGKILMVAQVLRFWPQYRAAYEIARSGELGQLLTVRAVHRGAPIGANSLMIRK